MLNPLQMLIANKTLILHNLMQQHRRGTNVSTHTHTHTHSLTTHSRTHTHTHIHDTHTHTRTHTHFPSTLHPLQMGGSLLLEGMEENSTLQEFDLRLTEMSQEREHRINELVKKSQDAIKTTPPLIDIVDMIVQVMCNTALVRNYGSTSYYNNKINFICRDGKRTETRIGMEGICINHSSLYTVYM